MVSDNPTRAPDERSPTAAPGRATPAARFGRLRRLGPAAAFVIVIAVVGAVAYSTSAGHAGRVVFSTDAPVNGTHSGCTVNDQVTSVTASTAVYATYVFRSAPGSEVISLTIDRDGQAYIPTKPLPTTYTKGYECFSDNSDLSKLPGWSRATYHFYVTAGGSVVAEGDLTVT